MDINLDPAMQSLDPTVQYLIINAARTWERDKQNTPPNVVAPTNAGRPGDEQYPAPIDTIRLLNAETRTDVSIYEVEFDVAGTTEHINIFVADDGSMEVRPAE